MDDVVSWYGSLFADFWKNIPIDLHTPFTFGDFCVSMGLEIIPLLLFLSLKWKISVLYAVLQQVAMQKMGQPWN